MLALSLFAGGYLTALSSPAVEASKAPSTVQVVADGKSIPGAVVDGTTFVSARAIGEALGRVVSWNPEENTVNIESRLDAIIKRGYIRVGTAGDYKPFTYLNPKTGEYEGYDIDAAKKMAKDLGVEVKFVQTSWPTLMSDLLADKFDIAMGGITRNVARQKTAQLTHPYIEFGKSPLIRLEDKEKFKSLADIDQPHVRIGVNPGGTNKVFVDANFKKAQVTVVENNLDIPGLVAEGKYDVMITDNIEAMLYSKEDKRLYAALTDDTFTTDEKGYLMHRGDQVFTNWVNLWMEEMTLKGEFEKLENQWIK
ncbi:transporter substrate-binding domain-containing protein [Ammoniphilus sp. CFH 90114]|nr:transporter substrate-binding domain-containing protein [Ammoniphilus sp. CFH 90114]